MKRMLIVINTLGLAGAEKALIALLRGLDYSRVSVSLLSILNRGELFAEIPPEVKILNKNPSSHAVLSGGRSSYVAKEVLRRSFRRGYIFRYLPYAFRNTIAQLKRGRFQFDKLFWLLLARTTPAPQEEYDLALAFIEGAATYYVAEKVSAKVKMTVVHINYEKAGYIKELDKVFYEKMDYIASVSESLKLALQTEVYPEFAERMHVFPNIINSHDIKLSAEKEGGFNDGFTGTRILTVGRLHPQKGFDAAIPALAKLVKQGYDNLRWYVLGEGTERAYLTELINSHGLTGKFILLGTQSNPYPYMKQCDIYVQPSRYEGLSLTLQEALTLNKPCITTKFDGIPELLTNEKDSLIIDFSEENIGAAVKRLADDKQLRQTIAEGTKDIKFNKQNKTHVLYDLLDGKKWTE